MEIRQCILTNNDCYKQGKKMTPKGIVVHSTGAKNPNLKRYVQPDDGILGDNPYNNDWNRSGVSKCVHAFIGKDKNGVVRVYQTLPWEYRPWGCGKGEKGSYNDDYIQFEICEDALTDEKYFNEAFGLAIQLCYELAEKYNLAYSTIVSHKEAHALGYASNHGDVDHWLKKFGKTMDWFRSEVAKVGKTTVSKPTATAPKFEVGDTVMYNGTTHYTSANATTAKACKGGKAKVTGYSEGAKHPYQLIRVSGGGATVYGWVDEKYISAIGVTAPTTTATTAASVYYPKYTGKSIYLDIILKEIGVENKFIGNWSKRKPLAIANGISNYEGTTTQNSALKALAKQGKLKKV